MPEPEEQTEPSKELIPAYADPLANVDLDRVYAPEQLRAELESISEEPLLEAGA